MYTVLEELSKNELIEMIKSLWIEKKLKQIEITCPDNDLRIDRLEELVLESGLEIEQKILIYFGYDV